MYSKSICRGVKAYKEKNGTKDESATSKMLSHPNKKHEANKSDTNKKGKFKDWDNDNK
jgi:hypothetical protein